MDEINNIIIQKEFEYMDKYKDEPKFLKIPLFVYELMKSYFARYLTNQNLINVDHDKEIVTFRGMVICPTVSIQTIDEIEVF